MKFLIDTQILKNITNILTKVVLKEISGTDNSGILIEVNSGKVYFKTQQFDFNLIYTSDVKGSVDGSVFVSIKVLDGVVSSLVEKETSFELVESKLIIKTSTSESEVYILEEKENLSEVKVPKENRFLTIKREILVRGFKSVQHAAADSAIKPEIASIFIYIKNNSIYFVSTDAFRLAEARILLDESDQVEDVDVIIPIKSISKVLRVLESISDVDVNLYAKEDAIYISTENTTIKTNSVNGVFPDYKNIIPKDFETEITLFKSDVLNFLKKARLFANQLNKLSFTSSSEKTITLEFDNETVGLTKNTIPATIKGEAKNIPTFNYRFISDALSVIQDERVVFRVPENNMKATMIRGAEDTSLIIVISPLASSA